MLRSLILLVALTFSQFASPAHAAPSERFNIVLIMADDIGIEGLGSGETGFEIGSFQHVLTEERKFNVRLVPQDAQEMEILLIASREEGDGSKGRPF